jgi:quercetin dioxygenase-like cupin family protein
MERKEPYATQEEFNKRVIRYRDVPAIELRPGSKSHIVSAEKIMVSFVTADPNSFGPVHRHEAEQIMIVTDGACDMIVEGKVYHIEKGDVLVFPSNMEHGSYISDKGCSAIDIFSPPRQDFIAKLEEVKKSQTS